MTSSDIKANDLLMEISNFMAVIVDKVTDFKCDRIHTENFWMSEQKPIPYIH